MFSRRAFLKGVTATTAAGLLVPERKIWALDGSMVTASPPQVTTVPDKIIISSSSHWEAGDVMHVGDELMLVTRVTSSDSYWGTQLDVIRAFAGSEKELFDRGFIANKDVHGLEVRSGRNRPTCDPIRT